MSIKALFFSSDFRKHVLTLMTGTTVAQAIPVLASPVISRVYSPSDFGIFALYFSWISIISILATCRYEQALIIPEKDEDVVNLVALAAVLSFYVSLICLVFVFYFCTELGNSYISNDTDKWIIYLPVTILIVGLYNTIDNWAIQQKEFRLLSISRVLRNAVYIIVAILWGLVGLSGEGLIIGHIIGVFVAFIVLAKLFVKHVINQHGSMSVFGWSKVVVLSRRYDRFPKYMIVARLLEVVAAELPIILLTSFYGLAVAGYFAFAKRVIQIPVSMVARAMADVFKQRASSDYIKNGDCFYIYRKTIRYLAWAALIPFAILAIISPYMFATIFGDEWRFAGEVAQILAVMCGIQFIASPIGSVFLITGKQNWDLWLQVYLVLGVSFSLYGGYVYGYGAKLSVVFLMIVYSSKYLIELFLANKFSKGKI